MVQLFGHLTGGYKSSAKVVGGTLILSLPDAVKPVVWRMDLGTAKSSAIEVRSNDKGQSELVLKTPKADAHIIAAYEEKLKATRALITITKAMSRVDAQSPIVIADSDENNRHLPIHVPQATAKKTPLQWIFRIVKYILGLLLLAVAISLVVIAGKIALGVKQGLNPMAIEAETKRIEKKLEEHSTTGQVISADDFLKKKQSN